MNPIASGKLVTMKPDSDCMDIVALRPLVSCLSCSFIFFFLLNDKIFCLQSVKAEPSEGAPSPFTDMDDENSPNDKVKDIGFLFFGFSFDLSR